MELQQKTMENATIHDRDGNAKVKRTVTMSRHVIQQGKAKVFYEGRFIIVPTLRKVRRVEKTGQLFD